MLLVLAALQVISALTQSDAINWSSWVGVAVVVIATVLMFLPVANPYFLKYRPAATAA